MNIEKYVDAVEIELENCCNIYFNDDSVISKAAKYSLLHAGKRTRAILIFLTAEMCGKDWKNYIKFACGVEMVHCYSLIHDDLPCMDNDDFRRGKPSCHKAFGEATALLAGDALLGCGLQVVANDTNFADHVKIKAIQAFTDAMGPKGMIYGQELDLEYENKPANLETLEKIHKNKTGKMISLCGFLGSVDSELSDEQKNALSLFFENIGLVFQIVDDILDIEGDSSYLGKPTGSDIENDKTTFVSLCGLENAKQIAAQLTKQADDALKQQFGGAAADLTEYTEFLLNRKK